MNSGKELVRIQRTSGNNLTVKSRVLGNFEPHQLKNNQPLWQNVVDLADGPKDMDPTDCNLFNEIILNAL